MAKRDSHDDDERDAPHRPAPPETAHKLRTEERADTPRAEPPTPKQAQTSIGVDYGGTGDYTYEDIPPPTNLDEMTQADQDAWYKPLHITRQGQDLFHVDTDSNGSWLYR